MNHTDTQVEAAMQLMRHQALHDPLTGLPNKKALEERFAFAKLSVVKTHKKFGFIFFYITNFKHLNDTLGHTIGDLVIKETADRLAKLVKPSDTITRLGGAEFVIILNGVESKRDIEASLVKFLDIFRDPVYVPGYDLQPAVAAGATIYPDDGDDLEILLKSADMALDTIKDTDQSRYAFYTREMKQQLELRLRMEQGLKRAVERKELEIFYQPYLDLRTNKVAGVEALIRWNHPELGLITPDKFISIAESTGTIVPIGQWVIESGLKQVEKWRREDGIELHLAVNVSPRQFFDPALVDKVRNAISNTTLRPNVLELEITEGIAMEDTPENTEKLRQLKEMGVALSMDDFGTGYSSLSRLKTVPVSKLKIDRSFTKNLLIDKQDAMIVRAIVFMGHTLGLKVCAEGIENEKQKDLLAAMGCDMAQGFYISKPQSAKPMTEWLLSQKPRHSHTV